MEHETLRDGLRLIFEGINLLRKSCRHGRQYTIDGRLVGDIGEIIAARQFEIILDTKSRKGYDAKTLDGRDVQIKATFKNHLTFSTVPDLYIGLKLEPDGNYEVVYNGPGKLIFNKFEHRKYIGEKLLSFSINEMRRISHLVQSEDRVSMRQL